MHEAQQDHPSRRRIRTHINLLPRVKTASQQAAVAAGQSLSNYIETLPMERLKQRGLLNDATDHEQGAQNDAESIQGFSTLCRRWRSS
jgi:hypothetical protein